MDNGYENFLARVILLTGAACLGSSIAQVPEHRDLRIRRGWHQKRYSGNATLRFALSRNAFTTWRNVFASYIYPFDTEET